MKDGPTISFILWPLVMDVDCLQLNTQDNTCVLLLNSTSVHFAISDAVEHAVDGRSEFIQFLCW